MFRVKFHLKDPLALRPNILESDLLPVVETFLHSCLELSLLELSFPFFFVLPILIDDVLDCRSDFRLHKLKVGGNEIDDDVLWAFSGLLNQLPVERDFGETASVLVEADVGTVHADFAVQTMQLSILVGSLPDESGGDDTDYAFDLAIFFASHAGGDIAVVKPLIVTALVVEQSLVGLDLVPSTFERVDREWAQLAPELKYLVDCLGWLSH